MTSRLSRVVGSNVNCYQNVLDGPLGNKRSLMVGGASDRFEGIGDASFGPAITTGSSPNGVERGHVPCNNGGGSGFKSDSLIILFSQLVESGYLQHPVEEMRICESHHGYVFLTGQYAYKVRKPHKIEGICDYSTLQSREFLLNKEIELNRVFGHDIYIRVMPVYKTAEGRFNEHGEGVLVEHLLKMRQMPPGSLLFEYFESGMDLQESEIDDLANIIAKFHSSTERVSTFNWEAFERQSEFVVGKAVGNHLSQNTSSFAQTMKGLVRDYHVIIDDRVAQGMVRDIHGDLRLENIFYTGGRFYPFDRIEFNDAFRRQDVARDVGAVMSDLLVLGQKGLAELFAGAYFAHIPGAKNDRILRLFIALRSCVNSMVNHDLSVGSNDVSYAGRRRLLSQQYLNVAIDTVQGV